MPKPEVTLYAKTQGCQQCVATKKHLDRLEIPYSVQYIDESESARDVVQLLGYQAVPVVVVGDMHWSGYRPTHIERLFEILHNAPDLSPSEEAAEQYLRDDFAA